MASTSQKLGGLNLDGLLAAGLRGAVPGTLATWEPPTPKDLAGVLPNYEIVRLIGRGGMSAVYEAWQVALGRRVAVKILPPELGADEAFAERFRREARALGRLEHANILEVFEFGESTAGHLYFSMQFAEGGDLGSRLRRGPLDPVESLRMVKEICAGLEAAHAQGVIHRDLKPSNILLTADGTVKVADFGIAVLGDQPMERLTHTGVAVGTMEYAAPEQAAGAPVDTRSDLYSVGVICYELLTGILPRGIFDPPSKMNAAVDPAVDGVVHTAMQGDPARRYQSATAFRTALNRTEGVRMRRSRRLPLAVAALIVLAAGAGAYHRWRGTTGIRVNSVSPSVAATSVVAWGRNEFGECSVPGGLTDAMAVAAGDAFTVALRKDGTVMAWGRNDYGQVNVPPGLSGVQAIAAGGYHCVALMTDGSVVAWGMNDHGQTAVPSGLTGVKAVSAGNAFTVALKSDGTVVGWGANDRGQLDAPPGLAGVESIAAGPYRVAAVKTDGTVFGWGYGSGRSAPGGLTDVQTVSAGWFHTVALKKDSTVVAWGANGDGQTDVPDGLTDVRAVAAGFRHSMALKNDGTVVAWGAAGTRARDGQADVPAGLKGAERIAAGFYHSVALVRGTPPEKQ
jgi:tRNA A-37 threonylcarbamoyl transferase component Bud32